MLCTVLAIALFAHLLVTQQPVFSDEFIILGNFWDFVTGLTLIPDHTAYPTLFSYLSSPLTGAFAAVLVAAGMPPTFQDVSEWFAYRPEMAMFPARVVSLLCWCVCVWAAYRMGRELLGGSNRGLIAAAALAAATGPLEYSGYGLPDVAMMMFAALALVYALRLVRAERWRRSALLAGLMAGLAMATKYTAVALVIPLLAALLVMPGPARRRAWVARRLAGTTFLGFIIGCPGWGLAPMHFWEGLASERAHMALGHLGFLGVPLLGQLELLATADPLLLVLAAAGAVMLIRSCRVRRAELLVLGALVAAVLLLTAPAKKQSLQYLFALYPALAVLAAGCAAPVRGRSRATVSGVVAVALLLVAGWSLCWSARVALLPDSLVVSRQWINGRMPEGAVVAVDWIGVPRLVEQEELDHLRADLRSAFVRGAYAGLRGFPSVEISYDDDFLRDGAADWIITSSACYSRFFHFGLFTRRPPPNDSPLHTQFRARSEFYRALEEGRYGWRLAYETFTGNGPRVRIYRRNGASAGSLADLGAPSPGV